MSPSFSATGSAANIPEAKVLPLLGSLDLSVLRRDSESVSHSHRASLELNPHSRMALHMHVLSSGFLQPQVAHLLSCD